MHPRILAQRTGIASEKLVANARRLAKAIDLPEDLVNALIPSTNNSQIRPMLVLEACAKLVEAAANRLIQPVETGEPELATVDDPGLSADEVAKLAEIEPKGKRGRTK